jgi:hypothetical protein
VYEKLTNDFEVMSRVLMTLVTKGHGELGFYNPVILDNKIVDVVVVVVVIASEVISILVAVVLLRVLRRCSLAIIFTCPVIA